MSSALGAHPREREVEDKLEALKLKEAYLRLREGDRKTAVSLVSTLHISPRLEEEVLKFYEEAGMPSAKLTCLKHKLSASLEALRHASPSVAATISIVYQLFDTQLLTLRTETATQESVASLKAEVDEVHWIVTNPGDGAASRLKRLEEQLERRDLACQKSLISLKGELETLKRELTEALDSLQCTRDTVDHLIEAERRKSGLFCSCRKRRTLVKLACSHSVCAICCQAYVLEQHSSPAFNIQAVGCPLCMTVIPSSVVLNQIFTSEADFKAKTTPMFECSLCLAKSKVEDSITLECDHRFCESCIKDYISHLVMSDNVDSTKLVCPSDRCGQEISDTLLHALLSQDVFDKLVEFRLSRLFDSCLSGCGYFADNDDRERFFNCEKCRAVYCRDCKERTNEQHRCRVRDPEETKGENRKLIAEMGGMACPRCGEGLFLENGSNFVKCPSSACLAYFCLLCEGVLSLEDHYTHYPLGPFGRVCVGGR
jgi:hypothetical protein